MILGSSNLPNKLQADELPFRTMTVSVIGTGVIPPNGNPGSTNMIQVLPYLRVTDSILQLPTVPAVANLSSITKYTLAAVKLVN